VNKLVASTPTDVHPSLRVAVTGPPGAGKSSLIERLGMYILESKPEARLAVLAIDPTSLRGAKGSILGDKTRMDNLSLHPRSFVRPSPTRGSAGGVTRATGDAITLVEAAGYDHVIVETVGVGQSEAAAEALVDIFMLCETPSGGDSLQGIKRGIMELADLLVVTKDDGDFVKGAARTSLEMRSALRLVEPKHSQADAPNWETKVIRVSAATGKNLDKLYALLLQLHSSLHATGALARRRAEQREEWFHTILADDLLHRSLAAPSLASHLHSLTASVRQGTISAGSAVDAFLDRLLPQH